MSIKRLFDFANQALVKYPQTNMYATKEKGEWVKTSTKEFIGLGNKISRGLLKLGIQPGDKIALITTATRTEWAVMDFGILQIGAITVPVYPSISAEDYEFIFNNAEIKYCFVSDIDLYKKVNSIKQKVATLEGIFSFDDLDGVANWKEILDLGNNESTQNEVEDISNSINEDDLATIIYTSGTTGKPKGVMLTHKNIVSNVLASDSRIPRKKGLNIEDTRALSFLPICHIFERMIFYLFTYNGISIYFAESIEKMGENIKEVKPHYMTVVPRLIEKVYDKIYDKGLSAGGLKSKIFLWALGVNKSKKEITSKPSTLAEIIADKLVFKKWREGLGGEIITLVSGSAALSERLNKMFWNAGIPILEGYGLTETSPVIAVNSMGRMKVGTVGHPLDNLKVKIQEDGEITVKGPSITQGYYKNEEQTKEAFTEDGYFKTGDIGHIDAEGFLKITDRKKEIFKTSGGKYVAPQPIENKMKENKYIEQMMVVGADRKFAGALIVPSFLNLKQWASENNITYTTVQDLIRNPKVLELYKNILEEYNPLFNHVEQVKKFALLSEEWSINNGEMTPKLSLKRKVITEKFKDVIDKIYE